MRKNCLLLAVLSLAFAFVSCKKDDKPAVTGDMMRFTATIGNGGEKTAIYDGRKVKWTEKDSVLINGKVFHSELEGDGKTAIFTGEALEAAEYEAYYLTDYAKSGDKYVLPAIQKYAAGDILSGVNPMYAYSTTTDLQFYNICAIMKLVVKGEGTVKTITVSADQPLSGAFEVKSDAAVGFYAKLTSTSKDAATLTLDCGETGVTLSEANSTTFYIALPQGEYTNLVFTLNNGSTTWSSDAFSMNLTAGKMRTKELIGVDVVKPVPPYCVSGEFTVGENKKVYFSKGNLQYYCGTASGGKNWRFAENQWDLLDKNTSEHTTSDYGASTNKWIDLFGWGTSGQNHGAVCYQPWSISTTYSDYYAYNGQNKNLSDDSGSADWGYSYCEQEGIEPRTTWRVLTGGSSGEWKYLFDSRSTTYSSGGTTNIRYAEVKVNGVCGILLFPDAFSWPTTTVSAPTTFNTNSSNWNGVNYGDADFAVLESAGCVFLPAAGYRYGTSVNSVGSYGRYWSSSYYNSYRAYYLYFGSGNVSPAYNDNRSNGYSVRLVRDVE